MRRLRIDSERNYRAANWEEQLGVTSTRCSLPRLNPRGRPLRGFPIWSWPMTEYWVFQEKSFKRACIHRSSCSVRRRFLQLSGNDIQATALHAEHLAKNLYVRGSVVAF